MSPLADLYGTPLYDMAIELAEQFTDDFDTQEEFIEGFLEAYLVVSGVAQ